MNLSAAHGQFVERFAAWGGSRRDMRAMFVHGSQIRLDHPADEWSDLDLIIVTTDPEFYLGSSEWLGNLGKLWFTFVFQSGLRNYTLRRAIFEGALEVDIIVVPNGLAQQVIAGERSPLVDEVLRYGTVCIMDKDGIAAKIVVPPKSMAYQKPITKELFTDTTYDFLYHAVMATKKLKRGELWMAKLSCDVFMKQHLLAMITWHAQAMNGVDYNTFSWGPGRFIDEWADARALVNLREVFARYDATDMRSALVASLDMFRWLGIETSEKYGLPYAIDAHERVARWIRACLR